LNFNSLQKVWPWLQTNLVLDFGWIDIDFAVPGLIVFLSEATAPSTLVTQAGLDPLGFELVAIPILINPNQS
jgi:hypothetical protein